MASGDIEARAERLGERLRHDGHFVTLAGAVSEVTAAELLDVSSRTLRRWRCDGCGPRWYRTRRVLYPLVDIVRYLDEITPPATGGHRWP